MMKRILYLFLSVLLLGASLGAQEVKHWTLGLSLEYGRLSQHKGYGVGHGSALVPSVRYNFNNNWSVGLNALLPLSLTKDVIKGLHYTTGGELAVTGSIEPLRELRLSLSAVGLLGITGNYQSQESLAIVPRGCYISSREFEDRTIHEHWRWAIGLRPKISYQFSSTWGLELGLGFWGYRSQKDLLEDPYGNTEGEKRIKGAWGFSDLLGWGSACRLGITYSF